MKILITCPKLTILGGVANHYLGLKPYWTENVKYLEIGRRNNRSGSGKYWFLIDLLSLVKDIVLFQPDIILFNPSIGLSALKRDFTLQKVARSFGIKTAIFIHGFNLSVFESLSKSWLVSHLNSASVIFVLANDFKARLKQIGVTTRIVLTSTKVDDRLIRNFDITKRDGQTGNLLFLARVHKDKGIHEALDAFKLIKPYYPQLKFNIVGDGEELETVKKRVKDEQIENVIFHGRLSGNNLVEAYESARLLILISYGEGMPTNVLEAMAFGLPVITRPVGGIVDFFENGNMGFVSNSLNPEVFADAIKNYLDTPVKISEIARYNHEYAKKHFMASKVAIQIEKELAQTIKI